MNWGVHLSLWADVMSEITLNIWRVRIRDLCTVFLGLMHSSYCTLWCVSRQLNNSAVLRWGADAILHNSQHMICCWLTSLALNLSYFQTAHFKGWASPSPCCAEHLNFAIQTSQENFKLYVAENSFDWHMYSRHMVRCWFTKNLICFFFAFLLVEDTFLISLDHLNLILGSQNPDRD